MDPRTIDSFRDEFRFLSNYWPCLVLLDGQIYPSTENAYQAAKTLDLQARAGFQTISAGQAKRKGRTLEIRLDWEVVKLSVMADLLRQKFEHPELRDLLLATGTRELIEGNTWGDRFFGVCRGTGENHLGRLLMQVRHGLSLTKPTSADTSP